MLSRVPDLQFTENSDDYNTDHSEIAPTRADPQN